MLAPISPRHRFLLAIDSDGCVFDSMEIKQKECFCPQFIKHYGLQRVARHARECWEFVNLYSKTRGINRFLALRAALELLRERPEVAARGLVLPPFQKFYEWLETAPNLGNPDLKAALDATGEPELAQAWNYSLAANAAVADLVRDVPPFAAARGFLTSLAERADAIVVSQTPTEALVREWAEHGLAAHVQTIAGQEAGTKTQSLRQVAESLYAPTRILMIGDAPGDLAAAREAGTCFYPILPGDEESSWQRLHTEGLDRFLAERYRGAYEDALVKAFEDALSASPPWMEHSGNKARKGS
jgi:phosphoglycolate phosphatase-like HAD superfamily hydrolase